MQNDDLLDRTRHSQALEAQLLSDPDEIAIAEGRNGLRQFDAAVEIVEFHIQQKRPFKLRPSVILHLHRFALEGISSYAGNYRPSGVIIGQSKHQPVDAFLVPAKVEDLCDYVNERWDKSSALHLAAYVLWRLNWIHPFTDGNGRTARATSYVVLCLRLGYLLSGPKSIPAQIAENKHPYYDALESADASDREGRIDVGELETLLDTLLARQLYEVLETARRKTNIR